MAYTVEDFKNGKALKTAFATGRAVRVYQPGPFGPEVKDGEVCLEGPHYPAAHSWYLTAYIKNGTVLLLDRKTPAETAAKLAKDTAKKAAQSAAQCRQEHEGPECTPARPRKRARTDHTWEDCKELCFGLCPQPEEFHLTRKGRQ